MVKESAASILLTGDGSAKAAVATNISGACVAHFCGIKRG